MKMGRQREARGRKRPRGRATGRNGPPGVGPY